MSRSGYGRMPCRICGQMVSVNGFGETAHKRKHVREGTLVELESTSLFMRGLMHVTPVEADRLLASGSYMKSRYFKL